MWKSAILSLLVLAIFLGVSSRLSPAQQPPAPVPVTAWEYAQFTVGGGQTDRYVWTTPKETIKAASWEDFGAKYPHPFQMGQNYLTCVLNGVGADGWELCVSSKGKTDRDSDSWIFKRLAK